MSASKGPSSIASGGATSVNIKDVQISLISQDQSIQQDQNNITIVNNSYVNKIGATASNVAAVGLSAMQNLAKQPSIGLVNFAKSATASVKSGSGSVITSTSDLERFERLMINAKHANKNIVRNFGKQLEEFRREMQYSKEIILSDLMT